MVPRLGKVAVVEVVVVGSNSSLVSAWRAASNAESFCRSGAPPVVIRFRTTEQYANAIKRERVQAELVDGVMLR